MAFNEKHLSLGFIGSLSLQKMSRMKSKDRLEKAVYEFLDWLEMKQPQLIDTFWRAAFVELLMNRYPTLRELHYSLMGGQSLHSAHDGTHILQDDNCGFPTRSRTQTCVSWSNRDPGWSHARRVCRWELLDSIDLARFDFKFSQIHLKGFCLLGH